jgi:hypothetical protein
MAVSERAGNIDETTMKFGLLMESAQAHQKMAESHLEKLRAHTQDLDGVVREEIRRTLIEELDELTAESRRAAQALKGMKRAAHLRGLIFNVATVVLSVAIPSALAYRLLPSPAQIETLRARRDELQASRKERRPHRLAALRRAGAAVRSRRPRRTLLRRQSRLPRGQGLLSRGLACRYLR